MCAFGVWITKDTAGFMLSPEPHVPEEGGRRVVRTPKQPLEGFRMTGTEGCCQPPADVQAVGVSVLAAAPPPSVKCWENCGPGPCARNLRGAGAAALPSKPPLTVNLHHREMIGVLFEPPRSSDWSGQQQETNASM